MKKYFSAFLQHRKKSKFVFLTKLYLHSLAWRGDIKASILNTFSPSQQNFPIPLSPIGRIGLSASLTPSPF